MKPCESKINEKDYKNNLLFPGRNSLIAFREAKDELMGAKMELHHANEMIEWLNCELEKAIGHRRVARMLAMSMSEIHGETMRITHKALSDALVVQIEAKHKTSEGE